MLDLFKIKAKKKVNSLEKIELNELSKHYPSSTRE